MSYALVVDDEDSILELMTAMLESLGWETTAVRSGAQAMAAVEKSVPAFVITDMIMPDMEGVEIIRHLRKLHRDLPVIVMSGNPVGTQFLNSARVLGARATLSKPFSRSELEAAVSQVVANP